MQRRHARARACVCVRVCVCRELHAEEKERKGLQEHTRKQSRRVLLSHLIFISAPTQSKFGDY